MTASIDGTTGITFNDASVQNTAATGFGFKNRIINGAMVIDQRNAGASFTPTADGAFTVDRWKLAIAQASKFSFQQNAGSVTPPTGYAKYLGATSLSAYTLLTADYFAIYQPIEGFNMGDLGWGTANAQTITLSFWVRSSITGTFSGSLYTNAGSTQSYVFNYTINSANTWEYETITVPGPTTGTWIINNTEFLQVRLGLGTGATYVTATTGSWITGNYVQSSGSTSVVGTSGATFYITGVQLEKGSTATSFDYRPYGTELSLCQRYFAILLASNTDYNIGVTRDSTTATQFVLYAPVTMRATPTLGVPSGYGRIVAYDTSFGITVNAVTSMVLLFTADNRILNIFTGTASYGGQYVYSAYDTVGATTAMTISSEL